jgi:hypothetical protein
MKRQPQASRKLPEAFIIHPKLVVTRQSGEAILKKMKSGKPTKALRDLMREGE